jgi:hypothetical protein
VEAGYKTLSSGEILQRLAALFRTPVYDRCVYCAFGPYDRLRRFQKRLKAEVEKGSFDNSLGKVDYISVSRAVLDLIREKGAYDRAAQLADQRRDDEFRAILSNSFRNLLSHIECHEVLGLVLSDFELLYAYQLGRNDLPQVRQRAINGKRICLLVPGAMRDGRLWLFDEDDESREVFPDSLIFKDSGWVFEVGD